MKSIDLSASLGFVPVPGLGFMIYLINQGQMRSFLALCLGIHLTDSSKIINITDSNWETYLGRQSYGEWLVEFTAKPEHCASCEIIDLAFNGHPPPKEDRLANG